jgi:putative hydrolase of the HAD superfamily
MQTRNFENTAFWIFDLDNTLYPPSARLFDQIEVKMTDYVMASLDVDRAEADRLRDHYWQKYGTTLSGLMREHDVDPAPYLVDVHDISLHALSPSADLAGLIAGLPGRKTVHTNGSRFHAERVLAARGLTGIFDAIYGIEHADFLPKPEAGAFLKIIERDGIDPSKAAFFEDDLRNLNEPFAMGMTTVHVSEKKSNDARHHFTNDLTDFLGQISTGSHV